MSIDITLYNGESASIRIQVLDQLLAIRNLAVTTGVFRIGTASAVILNKATSLVTDGTDGLMQLDLTAEETKYLPRNLFTYQFIVTDHDGDVQVVKENQVRIRGMIPAPAAIAATPVFNFTVTTATLTAA